MAKEEGYPVLSLLEGAVGASGKFPYLSKIKCGDEGIQLWLGRDGCC